MQAETPANTLPHENISNFNRASAKVAGQKIL